MAVKLSDFLEYTVNVPYSFNDDVTFTKGVKEAIETLSGTSAALDPSTGTIKIHALTGITTYTETLQAGEYVTVMIDDGTDYTVTWPTTVWVNNGGIAPTLATAGYTVVSLWKVGTTLYGALVGDGS